MLYVTPVGMTRSAPPALAAAAGAEDPARRAEALREFERVFLFQLLREMRNTVPKAGLLGDSPSQRYFEEMLDDAYAGQMAASGQFGIAGQIAAQWEAADAARRARAALDASSNPARVPIYTEGTEP